MKESSDTYRQNSAGLYRRHLLFDGRGSENDLVLAGTFSVVKLFIGLIHHVLNAFFRAVCRYTDGDGHADSGAVIFKGVFLNGNADAFCDPSGDDFIRLEQDQNFLAAPPEDTVIFSDGRGYDFGHTPQDFVSAFMPPGVVDEFKVIDIHHQEAERCHSCLGHPVGFLQIIVHAPPVQQMGEGVIVHVLFKLFHQEFSAEEGDQVDREEHEGETDEAERHIGNEVVIIGREQPGTFDNPGKNHGKDDSGSGEGNQFYIKEERQNDGKEDTECPEIRERPEIGDGVPLNEENQRHDVFSGCQFGREDNAVRAKTGMEQVDADQKIKDI